MADYIYKPEKNFITNLELNNFEIESLNSEISSVIFDFSNVKYITSNGVAKIINTQNILKERGIKFKIINADEHIKYTFTILNLSEIISID